MANRVGPAHDGRPVQADVVIHVVLSVMVGLLVVSRVALAVALGCLARSVVGLP